ncbi:hypothetical protein QTP88_009383 [Uroleucon formosanum]
MESTSYTIDFTARKFVHIGIDPTDEFQTVIHLITSSRHIKLTTDFLRRIFALIEETSLQDTKPSNTEHEMEVFIKLGTPLENTTTSPNLACQIQMNAHMQLLRIWVDHRRA